MNEDEEEDWDGMVDESTFVRNYLLFYLKDSMPMERM